MFVTVGDELIEAVIIHKNNKNIYFRFKEDLKLYITCNRFISEKEIKKIIEKNHKQILKMYNGQVKQNNANKYFNYLGSKYIRIINPENKKIYFEDNYFYYPDEKKLNKYIKEECRRVFTNEIEKCASYFVKLPQFSLKIRNMKTRWGVCNRKDNIVTLNSELLKKDLELIDYFIIHELCHFYEGNHSKKFWDLVASYYPNYKEARKRLKEC